MALVLFLYLIASTGLAVGFLSSSQPVGVIIGIAVLLFPILGFWALGRELLFGVRSERLLRQLSQDEHDSTREDISFPRMQRSEADALFPELQADVIREPENWRAWLRLSLGYDAAGDRRRARSAARRAIALSRTHQ